MLAVFLYYCSMYALVDCNNFFASCERVFRPQLQGKPIAVLSNNDGCVIARSNEVKPFVPMGAPAFKYKKVFKTNNVHVFSSNYALYGDFSNRVTSVLIEYCPDIEIYSIDESFLQFNGYENHNLNDYCLKMREDVFKRTHIPVSVGIGPTKALSKVANRIAKKFPERTQGVYIIDSEEKKIKALKWLKIGDVWGVGRRNAEKLKRYGIHTAYEFTQCHDSWVRSKFSVVGLRLKKELEGESVLGLDDFSKKKNIATTRTFEQEYDDYDNLRERITTFAITCAQKLRKQESQAHAIMAFIYTNGHKKEQPQYYKSTVVQIPDGSNSDFVISKYAVQALKAIYKEGYSYKRAGVVVMNLSDAKVKQLNLFSREKEDSKLMQAMDHLRTQGFHLKLASQDLQRTWKMNQNHLSRRYTTHWNELLEV
ncbi:protein ImpB [Flavobacteriaceae bacterium UJ101]|nr:protein ImpB [Flavobacteriaceae bacterium UJ101]